MPNFHLGVFISSPHGCGHPGPTASGGSAPLAGFPPPPLAWPPRTGLGPLLGTEPHGPRGPISDPSRRAHLWPFTEGPSLTLHGGPISDPSRRAHGQASWTPASSRWLLPKASPAWGVALTARVGRGHRGRSPASAPHLS